MPVTSSMLGIRALQAPYNVEKILDTINNLVRVLELTLTLNLSPALPPPTPPATVILPKATTLGSGLDQVSPQSACDIHSKVLTDRIATITKWATSVSRSPTISSLSNPLGGFSTAYTISLASYSSPTTTSCTGPSSGPPAHIHFTTPQGPSVACHPLCPTHHPLSPTQGHAP